jgi:hypothetical protein
VIWRELRLWPSYTLETSFAGGSFGSLKDMLYNITHYEELGWAFGLAILDFIHGKPTSISASMPSSTTVAAAPTVATDALLRSSVGIKDNSTDRKGHNKHVEHVVLVLEKKPVAALQSTSATLSRDTHSIAVQPLGVNDSKNHFGHNSNEPTSSDTSSPLLTLLHAPSLSSSGTAGTMTVASMLLGNDTLIPSSTIINMQPPNNVALGNAFTGNDRYDAKIASMSASNSASPSSQSSLSAHRRSSGASSSIVSGAGTRSRSLVSGNRQVTSLRSNSSIASPMLISSLNPNANTAKQRLLGTRTPSVSSMLVDSDTNDSASGNKGQSWLSNASGRRGISVSSSHTPAVANATNVTGTINSTATGSISRARHVPATPSPWSNKSNQPAGSSSVMTAARARLSNRSVASSSVIANGIVGAPVTQSTPTSQLATVVPTPMPITPLFPSSHSSNATNLIFPFGHLASVPSSSSSSSSSRGSSSSGNGGYAHGRPPTTRVAAAHRMGGGFANKRSHVTRTL